MDSTVIAGYGSGVVLPQRHGVEGIPAFRDESMERQFESLLGGYPSGGPWISPENDLWVVFNGSGTKIGVADIGEGGSLSNPRASDFPTNTSQYKDKYFSLAFSATRLAVVSAGNNTEKLRCAIFDRSTLALLGTAQVQPKKSDGTERSGSSPAVAFSPDATRVAFGVAVLEGNSVSAGFGYTLNMWEFDLDAGGALSQNTAHQRLWYTGDLVSLHYAPSGTRLFAALRADAQNTPGYMMFAGMASFSRKQSPNALKLISRRLGNISCSLQVGKYLFLGKREGGGDLPDGFPPLCVLNLESGEVRYAPKFDHGSDMGWWGYWVKNLLYDPYATRLYLLLNSRIAPLDGTPAYRCVSLNITDMQAGYRREYRFEERDTNYWLRSQLGRISGYVRGATGEPVARVVQALSQDGQLVQAQTVSDAVTGRYQLDLPNTEPVALVFRAAEGEALPDLFFSNVTPAQAPEPLPPQALTGWADYADGFPEYDADGYPPKPPLPPPDKNGVQQRWMWSCAGWYLGYPNWVYWGRGGEIWNNTYRVPL